MLRKKSTMELNVDNEIVIESADELIEFFNKLERDLEALRKKREHHSGSYSR